MRTATTHQLSAMATTPAEATTTFGLISGAGALFGLVANPIAGRLSDLTRARFGRRRTWILTGALGGAAGLVVIGFATSVWQVAVVWCLVAAVFNFQYAATQATIADQVPAHRRGGVSGLVGIGITVGPLGGIALANTLPAGGSAQWFVIAAVSVVLALIAIALLRDRPAVRRQEKLGLKGIAQTFWLNPRKYPAFGWAWLARFLLTCALASSTYNITISLTALVAVVFGYISDTVRRQKPFIMAAGGIFTLGLVVQALAPSVAIVFAAAGLLGIASGLFLATDLAMCVRVLPSGENAGKDLAIINIANTLPQSLVPFGVPGMIAVTKVPEIGQEAGGKYVVPIQSPRYQTGNA
ncbi:MFS transporter [Amycolatopsis sp. GM8]|uniref:MFS transporter n=1 Tax=Amycolatopsis sp. GM8 TaxID=2896530 RepID=UPI001F010211|nr:MFS transporter [Amycolatopsis sp. GM8]